MHFEQFIEKSQEDLQQHLNSIQRLYWALNEPDGVVGVAAVRKCPASLEDEILEHKSAGRLSCDPVVMIMVILVLIVVMR